MKQYFAYTLVLAAIHAASGSAIQAQIQIQPPPATPTPTPATEPATRPGPAPATVPATPPTAHALYLQELLKQRGTETLPAAAATQPVNNEPFLPREGQEISGRMGHLKKDAAGHTQVIIEGNPPIPPMGVVPSIRLALLEDVTEYGEKNMPVRITAVITQYRGKNYLYIKDYLNIKPVDNLPVEQPTTTPGPKAGGAVAAGGSGAGGDTLQQHVEPVPPNVPTAMRMREQDYVASRVGRLMKDLKTGASIFVFDADGRQMKDPPMGVVLSLNLAAMENAMGNLANPVKFRVSGEVTQYRGKNYLYIKAFTVVKDLNQGIGR